MIAYVSAVAFVTLVVAGAPVAWLRVPLFFAVASEVGSRTHA
jgi:hypothetical protein